MGAAARDMGDAGYVAPAAHPYAVIADPGAAGHSLEVAEAAAGPCEDQAPLCAAPRNTAKSQNRELRRALACAIL